MNAPVDVPTFELSDIGNGERLLHDHGENLRFCSRWKKWLAWNGRRWELDETGAVDRLAKQTVRQMKKSAALLGNTDRANDLWAHAHKTEGNNKIRDMIERASKEAGVVVLPDALDARPLLVNVANGTIDLDAFELRPHRREDLITRLCPVDYDPAAACPLWLEFLDRIFAGNGDLIRFIRRVVGYTLTGLTSERCLFILYGSGANGKSTFLAVLRALLGDYASQTPAETLMVKRNDRIPNDLARLKGARYVSAVETEEGRQLAEGLVKWLTGGEDVITARFMRGEWFDFRATFKLFVGTNHLPSIRGNDRAIWDRLRLIPFRVTIPPEERDPGLADRLRAELPGILAWAVEGCRDWRANGLGPPTEVTTATDDYRKEMDRIGEFVQECCVEGDGCEAGATELFNAYGVWCKLVGAEAVSQTAFGTRLGDRGYTPQRSTGGANKGRKIWRGIGIRASTNGEQ